MDAVRDPIDQLIDLSRELMVFADSANDEVCDDGCLCLFGLVKDCAYRIKFEAERERRVHEVRRQKLGVAHRRKEPR